MCSIKYLQHWVVNATEDLFCLWYKSMSYQTLLHSLYLNTRKHILIVSDRQKCIKIQEAGCICPWESLFSSANMNAFAKISEDRKMT